MSQLATLPDNTLVDELELAMLRHDGPVQTAKDFPVEHYFAPGLYARSLFRKAGTFIVGHAHKHAHLSIVLHGRLRVLSDGKVKEIVGPSKPFLSPAGIRKATYAMEDTTLITFHPTEETNPEKMEEALVDFSPAFQEYAETHLLQ